MLDDTLGMAAKFLTRNFDVVTLVFGLLKKTNGSAAADVAQSFQAMIQDNIKGDIHMVGTAGGIDTTASAR